MDSQFLTPTMGNILPTCASGYCALAVFHSVTLSSLQTLVLRSAVNSLSTPVNASLHRDSGSRGGKSLRHHRTPHSIRDVFLSGSVRLGHAVSGPYSSQHAAMAYSSSLESSVKSAVCSVPALRLPTVINASFDAMAAAQGIAP